MTDSESDQSSEDYRVEIVKEPRSCCRTLRKVCKFCVCIVSSIFMVLLAGIALLIAMGSRASVMEQDDAHYPHLDEDGFPMAYQKNGRWVNWWARNRPSSPAILWGFVTAKDNSNVPSSEAKLDEVLPVRLPYWKNFSSNQSPGSSGIRATWIGHATVLAEVDSTLVLTDPIFSKRASAVQWAGPKRFRPPACTVQELPDSLKAVVISHSHYDHLDYNSVRDLHDRYGSQLHWFVPKGMGVWFRDNFGTNETSLHEMVWWQEKEIPGTNASIAFAPSNHWGKRTPFDDNKALWGSWCVLGPKNKFWFGGDTAYCDAFAQIGSRFGPFQLSAIPIGAYEPRQTMRHVHVNPEEAVKIHKDLRSEKSFGIHWGTFKLTYEYFLEPKSRTETAAADAGLSVGEFQVIDLGNTIHG